MGGFLPAVARLQDLLTPTASKDACQVLHALIPAALFLPLRQFRHHLPRKPPYRSSAPLCLIGISSEKVGQRSASHSQVPPSLSSSLPHHWSSAHCLHDPWITKSSSICLIGIFILLHLLKPKSLSRCPTIIQIKHNYYSKVYTQDSNTPKPEGSCQ